MRKAKEKEKNKEQQAQVTTNETIQAEPQPAAENMTGDNTQKATDTAEQISTEAEVTTQLEEIKQKYESEIMEWKDKYLRLSAEFDNYRKRTLKEKMELTRYASEEVLKNILPIVDDFERGIKNLETATDIEAVKEGIFLIYNKFKDFLTQNGIKEITIEEDKAFNTDFHEAITKIPVDDQSLSGKVVDVVQKGYLLNDKVIRYAKVVVGE
ncbi:MAG: nucleotide exchange factor GrpE [Bacteroidales bacterium]|nr:nucleotide exchange factor GrpE [Bacteroidales bacterium]HOK98445.1 nucleotide exchange factor GrpE [Bacteroidales bacterium]HPO66126.1 nucleotide exchange factor GrpE [Bacteroidales bacterium]